MRKILFVFSMLLLVNAVHAALAADKRNENLMNRKGDEVFTVSNSFFGKDGATLYRENCQSCHMPKGEGVNTGAGMFPALADNPSVSFPAFTANIVMNGLRGMPAFSSDMSDEQIAAVSNFVATNFGNKGTEQITAADVAPMRPKVKVVYE